MRKQGSVMISLLLFVCVMLGCIAPAQGAFAASRRHALLGGVEGSVYVARDSGDEEQDAYDGMKVYEGDTVRTGWDGRVSVLIDEDQEVTLSEGTTMSFEELSARAGARHTGIRLWAGKVWNSLKRKLTGDESYEVRTSTAVMGARGTEYAVSVRNARTTLGVFSGAVLSAPRAELPGIPLPQPVMVYPDQMLMIQPGQMLPPVPQPMTPQMLDAFDMRMILHHPDPVSPDMVEHARQAVETMQQQEQQRQQQLQQEIRHMQESQGGIAPPPPTPVPQPEPVVSAPSVSGVSVSGHPVQGETLTAAYTFSNPGAQESNSLYQWYSGDAADGSDKVLIPQATARTFTLSANELNKYIFVKVTPVNSRGMTGTAVESVASEQVTANLAPSVRWAGVQGKLMAGSTLKAQYEFSGPESWQADQSVYQWYRKTAAGSTFDAIPGATARTYTLNAADTGAQFRVEITPKDSLGLSGQNATASTFSATGNPLAGKLVPFGSQVVTTSQSVTSLLMDNGHLMLSSGDALYQQTALTAESAASIVSDGNYWNSVGQLQYKAITPVPGSSGMYYGVDSASGAVVKLQAGGSRTLTPVQTLLALNYDGNDTVLPEAAELPDHYGIYAYNGKVYFLVSTQSDTSSGNYYAKVIQMNSDGTSAAVLADLGVESAHDFTDFRWITGDGNGNLIAVTDNGRAYSVTTSGVVNPVTVTPPEYTMTDTLYPVTMIQDYITAFTRGEDGWFYATVTGEQQSILQSYIVRWSPDLLTAGTPASVTLTGTGITSLSGIAVADTGSVFVMDSGNDTLYRYAPCTNLVATAFDNDDPVPVEVNYTGYSSGTIVDVRNASFDVQTQGASEIWTVDAATGKLTFGTKAFEGVGTGTAAVKYYVYMSDGVVFTMQLRNAGYTP